jgi:hypothetical protein
MPCGDNGQSTYSDHQEIVRLRSTVENLTAMLCDICRTSAVPLRSDIAVWYEAHQLEDAARLERMQKTRQASIARLEAKQSEIATELEQLRREAI